MIAETPCRLWANALKRLIDDVAQDGGFALSTGAVLDDARPENLHAMTDTAREYGVCSRDCSDSWLVNSRRLDGGEKYRE